MDRYSPDPTAEASDHDPARARHDARDSLFLMADVRVAGRPEAEPVRVRNLSARGLMAEYPARLSQGQAVEFDVRGIGWVAGIVAWSAAGRIGVTFPHPIDPMLARKPVGVGTKAPAFVTPVSIKPGGGWR